MYYNQVESSLSDVTLTVESTTPKTVYDNELIAAVAAGDPEAFELIVRKYENRVINTIYRYIGSDEYAEDLAQEVFIKVWQNASTFKGRSTFSTWLFRIVVNHTLNYRVKRSRRQTLPLDDDTPEVKRDTDDELAADERTSLVQMALGRLPKRQRMALVLSHFDGYSYKEIAEIMKTSLSSVESLIFRAKQNLKKELAPYIERGEL